jgi:hypothetical protein
MKNYNDLTGQFEDVSFDYFYGGVTKELSSGDDGYVAIGKLENGTNFCLIGCNAEDQCVTYEDELSIEDGLKKFLGSSSIYEDTEFLNSIARYVVANNQGEFPSLFESLVEYVEENAGDFPNDLLEMLIIASP